VLNLFDTSYQTATAQAWASARRNWPAANFLVGLTQKF
jgi:hypothetical protein